MKTQFSKNLFIARDMAGLSMENLAERADISRQAINKYEKGDMNPSLEVVEKLARALNQTVEYFFKNESEEQMVLENIKFRDRGDLLFEEEEIIKKKTIDHLKKFSELEEILNISEDFKNPVKNFPVKNKKDAELAAKTVRKKWKIGNSPILNVIELLEGKGIKVIEIRQSLNFQGLAAWVRKTPVIVINTTIDEVTRRRFTTLHELGHLILEIDEEKVTYDIVEKICNAFAAAMLLPEDILILELGQTRACISHPELVMIKEKYGISVHAIMYGAASAKIISWDQFSIWKTNNSTDFNGFYLGNEKTRKFMRMIFKGIGEGIIDRDKAAELSGLSVREIKEIEQTLIF